MGVKKHIIYLTAQISFNRSDCSFVGENCLITAVHCTHPLSSLKSKNPAFLTDNYVKVCFAAICSGVCKLKKIFVTMCTPQP